MMQVTIVGVAQTLAHIQKAVEGVHKAMEKAAKNASTILFNEVKDSISGKGPEGPFVTKSRPFPHPSVWHGGFKNSVKWAVNRQGKDLDVIVYSDIEYAPHLEFGTYAIPPRRHFRNSLTRKEGDVRQAFQENIRSMLP